MLSELDFLLDDSVIVPTSSAPGSGLLPEAEAAPSPEAEPAVQEGPERQIVEILPEAVAAAAAAGPAPEPEPVAPAAAVVVDGPGSILASRILADRPDVLNAYFAEHIRHDGRQHEGWVRQIGGSDSAEGYARYWYDRNGRFEGYSQGRITAGENIDVGRLLAERPDVLHAYQRDYLDHKGWKSHAWREILGGSESDDYARYWFRNHGQAEGYNQRPPAAAPDAPGPPAQPEPAPEELPATEPVVVEPETAAPPPAETPPAEPEQVPPPPPAVADDAASPPAEAEAVALVGGSPDDPIFA